MLLQVADWFAQLNNKMGGDLKKIQTVGRYMVEVREGGADLGGGSMFFQGSQGLFATNGVAMTSRRVTAPCTIVKEPSNSPPHSWHSNCLFWQKQTAECTVLTVQHAVHAVQPLDVCGDVCDIKSGAWPAAPCVHAGVEGSWHGPLCP